MSADDIESGLSSEYTWSDVSLLKDKLLNLREEMTAARYSRFYPTPVEAMAQIDQIVRKSGIASPEKAIYVASVGQIRLRVKAFDWRHTEFRIHTVRGESKHLPLNYRTIGDPNGAGLYGDTVTQQVGPQMCLTWQELKDAVNASYLSGAYAVNYVCHNDVTAVLEAIGVGAGYYEEQIPSWKLARWLYGKPWSRSGGYSEDPKDWAVVKRCKALGY